MGLFEVKHKIFDDAVKIISASGFPDDRGYLVLSYSEQVLLGLDIPNTFVREMHTRSKKNVLRGLHFQLDPPMGKLVQVIRGSVFAAVVDVRTDSKTFLGHHTFELEDVSPSLVWIPSGFAFGYYTLEPDTIVHYKCDAYVGGDRAIAWNDPDIGIKWPATNPILSKRDEAALLSCDQFGGEYELKRAIIKRLV